MKMILSTPPLTSALPVDASPVTNETKSWLWPQAARADVTNWEK